MSGEAARNAVMQEMVRMGVFKDDGVKRDELAWSCADAALRSSARDLGPAAFLAALRAIHPAIEGFGLEGGCFQVYLLLKAVFPNADPYYDGNHVIARIGDAYWDIRGEVLPDGHVPMKDDALQFNRAYHWGRSSAPAAARANKPCATCGGTGRVPTVAIATGWEPDDRPCPSCMSVSPPPERIWLNWRPVDVQRVNCTAWYFPPPPDSRGDSQHVEYVRADPSGAALAEERSRVAALEDALRDARGGFDRLRHRAKVRGGPDTSAVHMAKMAIQAIEAALSSVPREAGAPGDGGTT